MSNIKYLTLAAVRAADPQKFDAMIKQAFHDAAAKVGNEVLMAAFYGDNVSQAKAAA